MKKQLLIPALLIAAFSAKAQQAQTTAKGVSYTIFASGAGAKIKAEDVITFNIEQRTQKDSVLFSTYKMGRAVQTQVKPSQNVMDLMDIFPLLAANDRAFVKIPVDSIFKGHEGEMPPFLHKGEQILTTLKIQKVQSVTEAMAERNAELEKIKGAEALDAAKYIADNKLAVTTTPTGLKYVITTPSVKPKPKNGDTVLVNYIGRTLSGKVFDSSIEAEAKKAGLSQPGRNYEPISVTLGQGGVIRGWEEALLLLNEGAKATLVIPSTLGYGERGAGADIKPYSTLVFDIEVVKVKKAKVVAAKPAAKGKAGAKKPVAKKPLAKKTAAGKKKN
jgi:FKBP-type peptidyl-prolyl cis-trans isomerase FkpA